MSGRAVARISRNPGSSTTSSGGSINLSANVTGWPTAYDLAVLTIFFRSATITVTSVDWGTGTWLQARREVGATSAMEVWVGYNFDGVEQDNTPSWLLSASTNHTGILSVFRNGAVQDEAPTLSGWVGQSSDVAPSNPGAITPTADDESQILFVATGHSNTTVPTYTHTPGTNEQFSISGAAGSAHYHSHANRIPTSLTPHNLSAIPAASEWVSTGGLIIPKSATVHPTTHLYKGRTKKSLDLAGVA